MSQKSSLMKSPQYVPGALTSDSRWIESGELRAAKLGAQWRTRPKDLELFIADRVR